MYSATRPRRAIPLLLVGFCLLSLCLTFFLYLVIYKQNETSIVRELGKLAVDRVGWPGFMKKLCGFLGGL